MGDRAIATMGKAVSRYQLNGLIKSPCQRYIILLDFDAQKYAIDLALKLILYKKVKVVFFEDSRDVNDLGKKAVLRKVYRTRYTTYQELIKLKNLL
jgi:DNA primase